MITNVKKISLLLIAAVLVMALAFAGAASAATAITNATDFQEALGGDQYASIDGNVVTLKKNVQLDDELSIENATGLTLDLNGYTVTAMEGGILFNVEEYQDDEGVKHPSFFTLNDSIGTGKLIGNGTSSYTTYCVSVDGGGGERHNATFTMNGGSITSCAGLVNAVSLNNGATFTMNGGNITNCSGSVGGVAVLSSTFNMNGGTITGCSGNDAGGVFVESGTFNMNGGTITGCTVNTEGVVGSGGGGVRVGFSSTFNVTGSATITGNTNSTGAANNVCLLDNNYLNLVGDLTGSIGILSVTWDIQEPKLGEQFGTAATGASGADHFFADTNASLVGSINATNALVWTTKPSIAYVEVKTWDELVTNVTEWNKKDEMLTIVVMQDLTNTTGGTNYTGIPVNGKVTIMPKANAGEIKIDANQEGRLFEVKANGNLKLVGNGTATLALTNGKYMAQTDGYGGGGAIYVDGGTLTLSTGAKISNCSAANVGLDEYDSGAGGAIYVDGGTLTLSTGAMISNCSLVNVNDKGGAAGGAVFISTTSTIVMSGGCIKDCTALHGGGVYVSEGTFNMTGGIIDNCSTNKYSGGGVYVSKNTEFNMTGGSITKCSARDYGGGVYVMQGGKFTMAGGIIDNCRSTKSSNAGGGGVCTVGAFTMTDGTIINCSAGYGGGAVMLGNYNPYSGSFTMTGGTITNCSAGTCGGGVYVQSSSALGGTFTMTGGSITKCSAGTCGGGVHIDGGSRGVVKVGGTANITGNTKGTNPGSANNVYLWTNPNAKKVINVISPLTAGAQINVTTEYAPTASSPINITSVCGSGNETYFGSDNTNYVVGYNPTTKTVQLGLPLQVTYDGNGNTSGTVPVDSKKYKLGETVTVRGNTGNLGKTGHNFTGWENTTHHVFKQGDTFTITGITTLKANWTANVTTVNYRNATAINATKDYAYNTIADIPEIPAKRGYVFNGWRNMSDGSLFYKNATSFNSTYFNTSGYWIFSGDNASIINVIENLTANVTTVTFKNEITPEKEGKYTFDADAENADVLTKPGHMFIGWFDAGKVKVFNATGELNKSTTYASGTKWNYADPSLTLWANFTVNTYNITYIQPDHGTVSGNANATYNSTVTVTATPADGFMFKELIVTENGTAQKVTSTGKTFKMPAFDVNVTADFVPKKEEIIVSSDTISFGTVDLKTTSKGAEGLTRTLNVTNNLNDTVTLDLNESVEGAFNISPSISTKLAPYTSKTYTITIKPTYYTTVNDYAALLNLTNGTAAFDQTVVLSLSIVNTTDVRKNTTVVPDLPQMDVKTNTTDGTQNVTIDEKNTEVIISEEGAKTVIIRNDTDAKVAMVITNAINSTVSGKQEIQTTTESQVTNVYTVVKADLLKPENEKIEYQVIVSYGNTIPSQSPVSLSGDFNDTYATAVNSTYTTAKVLSMIATENANLGLLDAEIEEVSITFVIPKDNVTDSTNLRAYHVSASDITEIEPTITENGNYYNMTVTGDGFSAYVASELFSEPVPPTPYVPSSHSKETGSTVILKDGEVIPTVTPTPSGNATILPTARPTQPTTSKSPAPFVGIIAGLGAALVIARMRR